MATVICCLGRVELSCAGCWTRPWVCPQAGSPSLGLCFFFVFSFCSLFENTYSFQAVVRIFAIICFLIFRTHDKNFFFFPYVNWEALKYIQIRSLKSFPFPGYKLSSKYLLWNFKILLAQLNTYLISIWDITNVNFTDVFDSLSEFLQGLQKRHE